MRVKTPYLFIVREDAPTFVLRRDEDGSGPGGSVAYEYVWHVLERYVRAGFIVAYASSAGGREHWYTCNSRNLDIDSIDYDETFPASMAEYDDDDVYSITPEEVEAILDLERVGENPLSNVIVRFRHYDPSSLADAVLAADAPDYDENIDPVMQPGFVCPEQRW